MSTRVGTGLVLLLGFAFFTSVRLLLDVAERAPTSRNQEHLRNWQEDRLDHVRPLLPAHGTIGFLDETGASAENYFLTQYAVAPVVVVRDGNRDLVIGAFRPGAVPPPPPSPRHEVVFEDRDRGNICWKAK